MLAPPVKNGELVPNCGAALEEGLSFNLSLKKVGGMRMNLSWRQSILLLIPIASLV